MADKTFTFNGRNVVLRDPANVQFDSPFIEETYRYFFGCVAGGRAYAPQIDIDDLGANPNPYDIVAKATLHNEDVKLPSARASNPARLTVQFHVRHFLESHPEFLGLLWNTVTSASVSIANAQLLLGATVDGTNFISAKSLIDQVASSTRNRVRDTSEGQSGVSVLGTISELLLARAFEGMIGDEFFKVGSNDVNSYGDFVALCLPNNLWISVKSNFGRERLLASGYSNDIVGAGFFVESAEFTNPVRVRNFQRAGFLAMYIPDVAVTDAQAAARTSTFEEVVGVYDAGDGRPVNINGRPFIRPLSSLANDIAALLAVVPVSRRLTVRF